MCVSAALGSDASRQLRIEELFEDGLLATDVVVLQIRAVEIRLERHKPFSELNHCCVYVEHIGA